MNLRKIFVIVSFGAFLSACGISPTQTIEEPGQTSEVTSDGDDFDENLLALIETTYANNQDKLARNLSLLSLADEYKTAGNCNAANIIIKHTQASDNSATYKAVSSLFKAECALASLDATHDLKAKQSSITLITQWLETANNKGISTAKLPAFRKSGNTGAKTAKIRDEQAHNTITLASRAKIASALLLAQNTQYTSALHQLLSDNFISSLVNKPQLSTHFYNKAWEWFSLVDKQDREPLATAYPILREYTALLDLIENKSINDSKRQFAIKQWLSTNPNQLVLSNLPKQIQIYLEMENYQNQNIAVLLPLSGRLSAQGEAIQQGILAAYYDSLAKAEDDIKRSSTIEFIDTGSQNSLSSNISAELLFPYDTIIGPLLRSHVDEVNAFALNDKRVLILNQTTANSQIDNKQMASFSLAPEQEAVQVVAFMRSRNIMNPVIIDDGSSTTQRMNKAFIEAWQATDLSKDDAKKPLQRISYTNNKSMRVGIISALDVLQSERRIKQLSNLHQDRVHSVTRNRMDIDAFVIFARPSDVALINPIIESSISLFTNEQIPVFATSYGYDHKQSKNSQRDLRSLIFVDMPWLLPTHRSDALSVSIDTLFNQPPSTFLRLFAFGYDTLAVVDNLAQLSIFEHLSITGLTGNLSVNGTSQLKRELSWLSISGNSSL